MRLVHLFPFLPRGRHGGTLRLSAAVNATSALGEPEIHCFDAAAGAWRGPLDQNVLAAMIEEVPPEPPRGSVALKRRLFPSTLWESGRHACRALGPYADRLELDSATVLFLHTTYLAPSLTSLSRARARIIDVYDLVWAAHRNDAAAARVPARALRLAYAATTRRREETALGRADGLVAAGYADAAALARIGLAAPWIPTPTPVAPVPLGPRAGDVLRVGLLGNFAHVSTRASLDAVLRSEAASDPSIRIVVAGLHAERLVRGGERVEVLGHVAAAEDFYARVDCVVAPVLGGSGIKCKLAEGILAGRPVITTELGAAGYSPGLRPSFFVCEPGELDRAAIDRAVAGADPGAARARFERVIGPEAVAGAYGAAVRATLERRG